MQLGVSINPKSADLVRECVSAVEDAGIDLLAHPDSQAIDREVYSSLAAAAEHSESPRLAVMATNPVTRHISVTASAISTIDDLSNGRATLCMAIGDSAVRNTELESASLKELKEAVESIRELLSDGRTEWRNGTSNMNWGPESDLPVYIATTGPKTLATAGRVADGAVFYGDQDRIEWALEQVAEGARAAGRNPEDVEFWVATAGEIADTKDEAIDSLRHTLAASLHFQGKHGALEEYSDDVANRIRRLSEDYRPDLHNTFDNPHNANLIDEYDLRDVVENRPIAGTPSQVCEQLNRCDEMGVDGATLLLRHDHPIKTIQKMGEEIVPKF